LNSHSGERYFSAQRMMPASGRLSKNCAADRTLAPTTDYKAGREFSGKNPLRIESVNFEMRTERRSVTCSSKIFHAGYRVSESCRFAKLLRVIDSRSDKESS
jgi:hypothetical protein